MIKCCNFYYFSKKEKFLFPLIKGIIEFTLSLILLFDPFTKILEHIRILGFELIVEGIFDLPDCVGGQAIFPLHHSISSTGVGCLLSCVLSTFPLLMWMTRSAMGVRAVLWVMTTTVMPSCRQVSWSSFKICLPVT